MSRVDYLTARGWLSQQERSFLHAAARGVHEDRSVIRPQILEVGAEFGASTVCFSQGCPDSIIISLDLWKDDLLQTHRQEIAKAGVSNSLQVVGDSMIWGPLWSLPVDLCFIDGGHTYPVAKSDAIWFARWTRVGRLCIFHDCRGTHPIHREVDRAVDEWKASPPAGKWEELPVVDTMRVFRRVGL